MYMRGYQGAMMKHSWKRFMENYGFQFSKTKRKDLAFWFLKMLNWACRLNPRHADPILRGRHHHQHHPQQAANVADLAHEHMYDNGAGGFDDFFEIPPVVDPNNNGGHNGNGDNENQGGGNGHGNGHGEIGIGNNGHGDGNGNGHGNGHDNGHGNGHGEVDIGNNGNGDGNGNGNGIGGNGDLIEHGQGGHIVNEGITFEQIRATINQIRELNDNARIAIYDLAPEILAPETLFDDPTDNSARWTDVLIAEHGAAIITERPHLRSAVTNVKNRIKTRRKRILEADGNLTAAELEELDENTLANRQYKLFCVFCLQRYQTGSHTAKLCREGRILRKLATFLHHGQQVPPNINLD